MATLPVPQAALVQCEGLVDNQLTILDLSFVNSAAVTSVNLASLVAGVGDWFVSELRVLLSADWASTRVVGTDLSDLTGPRVELPAPGSGGVSGEAAPNNVAACVSFRTDRRGRSGRGRNFVPGLPNNLVTLNTLDGDFISNLLNAYALLIGAGTFVVGWEWCVVSRRFNNADRTPPITIPITSVTMVTSTVRSMRSREVGHGA